MAVTTGHFFLLFLFLSLHGTILLANSGTIPANQTTTSTSTTNLSRPQFTYGRVEPSIRISSGDGDVYAFRLYSGFYHTMPVYDDRMKGGNGNQSSTSLVDGSEDDAMETIILPVSDTANSFNRNETFGQVMMAPVNGSIPKYTIEMFPVTESLNSSTGEGSSTSSSGMPFQPEPTQKPASKIDANNNNNNDPLPSKPAFHWLTWTNAAGIIILILIIILLVAMAFTVRLVYRTQFIDGCTAAAASSSSSSNAVQNYCAIYSAASQEVAVAHIA